MKVTTNLFANWKRGLIAKQKVYLIRIYFEDKAGNSRTCLKLGRTEQLLHDRVIRFLGEMRKATGFLITHYEVISLLYNSNCTGIEYGLHQNLTHLNFFTDTGNHIQFSGSSEILYDTPENCELIQCPDSRFGKGEYIVQYNFRQIKYSPYVSASNVV